MKKIIILFAMLCSLSALSQSWKQIYYVPRKNVPFGVSLPDKQIVLEGDSSAFYILRRQVSSTDSMSTVFRNGYYVRIGGGGGSSDTTNWNIADKSWVYGYSAKKDSISFYSTLGRTTQTNPNDSLLLNGIVTFKGTGYINSRSSTYPLKNYARLIFNGQSGTMQESVGYNGSGVYAGSSIIHTTAPAALGISWLFNSSGLGNFKYNLSAEGLYPSIYSTGADRNQFLGVPLYPWNDGYLKKIHLTALSTGEPTDSILSKKDGEVKQIPASTFAMSADTTKYPFYYANGEVELRDPTDTVNVTNFKTRKLYATVPNWADFTQNSTFDTLLFVRNNLVRKVRMQEWLKYYDTLHYSVKVAILGNSTVATSQLFKSVGSYMPTSNFDLSYPGSTISGQRTKWRQLTEVQRKSVSYVFVDIGINNCWGADASDAPAIVAELQSLIDTIRLSTEHSTKIIIDKITPCRAKFISEQGLSMGEDSYALWLALNSEITDGGITGVDYRINSYSDLLNDGSGNLLATYDYGDSIHPNKKARKILAGLWMNYIDSVEFSRKGNINSAGNYTYWMQRYDSGNETYVNLDSINSVNARSINVTADKSANIAPALTTPNWTLGTGWRYLTSPDRIDKNADGLGTVTPAASSGIAIGSTYKVTITVSAYSGTGIAFYTLGGVTGTYLTATGTYVDYIRALSTGDLIITPGNGLRITITGIEVEPITITTGTAIVEGSVKIGGTLNVAGPVIAGDTSVIPKENINTTKTFISNSSAGIAMLNYGNTGSLALKRFGGTYSTPSATPAGNIFSLNAGGYGTSELNNKAAILFVAPTLWSATNSETAIQFQTTNAASTTKVDKMRICSDGVGVGLTVPTAAFHVKSAGSTSATTAFKIDNSSGTNLFTMLDDGKVGIGTSAPGSPLDVYSAGVQKFIVGSSFTITANDFYPSVTNSYKLGAATRRWSSLYTNLLTDNGGSLGIGTTAPSQPLDVNGNIQLLYNLYFENTSTSIGMGANGLTYNVYNGAGRGHHFKTANLERLSILYDGTVGIGTTSPTALLDINSDIVRVRTAKTPSSATDTGNAGDICWDANYIYICTATNTWKRTAITTW